MTVRPTYVDIDTAGLYLVCECDLGTGLLGFGLGNARLRVRLSVLCLLVERVVAVVVRQDGRKAKQMTAEKPESCVQMLADVARIPVLPYQPLPPLL